MSAARTSPVLRFIRRMVARGQAGLGDRELLQCYLERRDETAFAAGRAAWADGASWSLITRIKVRDQAMRELEQMADAIAPDLTKAMANELTLELKQRLEKLLDKFSSSQRLRTVQALEQIGTPAARELLDRLAEGVPHALLTREARASAARHKRR